MTRDEFERWLDSKVEDGSLAREQREDLSQQRSPFDEYRDQLLDEFGDDDLGGGLDSVAVVVGFQDGERIVAESVGALLARAREHPGSLIYFEPIGYNPFGSSVAGGPA